MLRIKVGDFMIDLPDSFSESVTKQTGFSNIEDNLSLINKLSVGKKDIKYLSIFPNLEEITFKSFPSIRNEDLQLVNKLVPNLKRLYIIEQNALFEIDLSIFSNLEEIHVLHCDNIKSILHLDRIHTIELVGNRNLTNLESIFSAIFNDTVLKLDIKYLYDLRRYFFENKQNVDLFERVTWVEGIGLKDHKEFVYKKYMLEELTKMFNEIYYRYVFVNDDDLFKFSVLYKWFIENVRFENVSDKSETSVPSFSVINYGIGNRVTYANAFNLLLCMAGIKSTVVYSIDSLDSIGKFNGKDAYSVLGASDYALLRVEINGQTYYADVAWDAYVTSFNKFDAAKVYLSSKDEIRQIHNIVGESSIMESSSYHGDDADDELELVERRISNVDVILNDIDMSLPSIDGKMVNIEFNKSEIERLKDSMELVDKDSDEYKKMEEDIINMSVEIKEYTTKLNEFKKEREKDIVKYKDFIMNSYYTDNYEVLYEYGFISDYIFDLIKVASNSENSD